MHDTQHLLVSSHQKAAYRLLKTYEYFETNVKKESLAIGYNDPVLGFWPYVGWT